MSKSYLPLALFNAYIENNVKPALEVVGTNLRNPNKLNQVAAKMLGYKSYEAIQPLHHREKRINESLWAERCPFQGGRICIKAANIIMVFDTESQCLLIRALEKEQVIIPVTRQNAHALLELDNVDMNFDTKGLIYTPEGEDLLYPQYDITLTVKDGSEHSLAIKRTEEGVIGDIIFNVHDEQSDLDTFAIAFDDADAFDDDGNNLVDQANATLSTLPCTHSYVYRWLKAYECEDYCVISEINPDEEVSVSSFFFDSAEEAIEAIGLEHLGIDSEFMIDENALLIRQEKRLVGSAYDLLSSAKKQ